MMGYGYGYGWMMMWMPLIGIVLVVSFLYLLIRQNKDHTRTASDAESILAERYVRGEISEEEYKRMKQVLKH